MTDRSERIHSASRIIEASPQRIYEALPNPAAIVRWRPPKGMTAKIHRLRCP
ncbi:MAG: hypothetical protein AB7F09_16270 [Parvibaculaceae bacterium]